MRTPSGIRTRDLRIKSPQLWPLSYRRMAENKGVEPSPLPTARLSRPVAHHWALSSKVWVERFELSSSRPRTARATKLRHTQMSRDSRI